MMLLWQFCGCSVELVIVAIAVIVIVIVCMVYAGDHEDAVDMLSSGGRR